MNIFVGLLFRSSFFSLRNCHHLSRCIVACKEYELVMSVICMRTSSLRARSFVNIYFVCSLGVMKYNLIILFSLSFFRMKLFAGWMY